KDERIKTVRTIFEERGLEIVTPTSLQVPLSFKEGDVSLFSRADMDTTNELLNKFISEHVTAGTKRVLLWQDEEAINLGVIKTIDGIPELHYITIDVGK
ncbi:MAG: hypothetical protein QXE82_01485, partial [Candidatus Nitrosotenuis sp.]